MTSPRCCRGTMVKGPSLPPALKTRWHRNARRPRFRSGNLRRLVSAILSPTLTINGQPDHGKISGRAGWGLGTADDYGDSVTSTGAVFNAPSGILILIRNLRTQPPSRLHSLVDVQQGTPSIPDLTDHQHFLRSALRRLPASAANNNYFYSHR